MAFALQVTQWLGPGFLVAVTLIVFVKLSNGTIDIGKVSPGRAQLLIVTIGCAGYYAYKAAVLAPCGELPKADPALLALLGASHGTYLSLKLAEQWSVLFQQS